MAGSHSTSRLTGHNRPLVSVVRYVSTWWAFSSAVTHHTHTIYRASMERHLLEKKKKSWMSTVRPAVAHGIRCLAVWGSQL